MLDWLHQAVIVELDLGHALLIGVVLIEWPSTEAVVTVQVLAEAEPALACEAVFAAGRGETAPGKEAAAVSRAVAEKTAAAAQGAAVGP